MTEVKVIKDLSDTNNLDDIILLIQKQMKVIDGNTEYGRIKKALYNALQTSNKAVLFLCLSDGNMKQGFAFGNICSGLETGADYFWINELYIDPLFRNKNIASELLVFIEKWAKKNQIKYVACSTGCRNIPAQKLYKKNGFSVNKTMWVDKTIISPK